MRRTRVPTLLLLLAACHSAPTRTHARPIPPAFPDTTGCPSSADTLWVARAEPVPARWVEAAIRPRLTHGCLPSHRVQRRLVLDTAARRYYAALLVGDARRSAPWDSVEALRWISQADDPRYAPLMLRFARAWLRRAPTAVAADLRTIALGSLALPGRHATAAGAFLDSVARGPGYTGVRNIALYALLSVNDEPAREVLRAFEAEAAAAPPPGSWDGLRRWVALALGGPPCLPGTRWEESHGVEGQIFRGCRPNWWRF